MLLLLIPAVILFVLGCFVVRYTIPDLQFGGIFTGLFLITLGFLIGSFVLSPFAFIPCAVASYGIYWMLEQRGVFAAMFEKI